MAWRLSRGATTIYLQNPERLDTVQVEKFGSIAYSAGGQRYYSSKGVTKYRILARWAALRDSEKVALEAFYDTTCNGPQHYFTLRDHFHNIWQAFFNTQILSFSVVQDRLKSTTTFASGGSNYPTTRREEPVWACSILLEIQEGAAESTTSTTSTEAA